MDSDWYVLHVRSGKEQEIKEKIEKYSIDPLQLIVFQREIIHTIKGKNIKLMRPLFSGYIFVYQSIIEVCEISRLYLSNEYISPISINNKPCQVYKYEMELLINSANKNGTFPLSYGYKIGNKVEIINGPLKDYNKNILWIDESKYKAKVELSLFQRKMRVNLGLEVFNSMMNLFN